MTIALMRSHFKAKFRAYKCSIGVIRCTRIFESTESTILEVYYLLKILLIQT